MECSLFALTDNDDKETKVSTNEIGNRARSNTVELRIVFELYCIHATCCDPGEVVPDIHATSRSPTNMFILGKAKKCLIILSKMKLQVHEPSKEDTMSHAEL